MAHADVVRIVNSNLSYTYIPFGKVISGSRDRLLLSAEPLL